MTATIRGMASLMRKLRDNPPWAEHAAAHLLDRWRFFVTEEAKSRAPVWSGGFRDSIQSERSGKAIFGKAIVFSDHPAAAPIIEGSRPHWPPIAAITPWSQAHGISPFLVAWGIAQHGTKPHRVLEEAAQVSEGKLPAYMSESARIIEAEAPRSG